MSLFEKSSEKKWQKETEESVRVYNELKAHEATWPEVQKAYEAGRDEVVRLTREYNDLFQAEGQCARTRAKAAELTIAKHKRDDAKLRYGLIKNNLENELAGWVRPFINEKSEEWEDETKRKVKTDRVNEVVPKEKDEPGTFTMRIKGGSRWRDNLRAIYLFRLKSLDIRMRLRDMGHFSIPLIREFLDKAEAEIDAIDLTPITTELDETGFRQRKRDSIKDGSTTPKAPAGKEGDDLETAYDDVKKSFKPKP